MYDLHLGGLTIYLCGHLFFQKKRDDNAELDTTRAGQYINRQELLQIHGHTFQGLAASALYYAFGWKVDEAEADTTRTWQYISRQWITYTHTTFTSVSPIGLKDSVHLYFIIPFGWNMDENRGRHAKTWTIYQETSILCGTLCGKVGSYFPMVCNLQYRTLTNCMYWFPLPTKLPMMIWPVQRWERRKTLNK